MTIALAIETSSRETGFAIGSSDRVLYDSTTDAAFDAALDLGTNVSRAMKLCGVTPRDLGLIVVDAGPGGLNAVRSGVAFANALGHSLGIPVLPVSSVEVLAREVFRLLKLPSICIRGAHRSNLHVAVSDGRQILETHAGRMEDVAPKLSRLTGKHGVAGRFRAELVPLLGNGIAVDSGIETPSAKLLLSFGFDPEFAGRAQTTPVSAIGIGAGA